MGRVIDEIKLEKMGASSILNHLKNRGVKDEEIKQSGIEAWLEGKKSVTKAERQEFVAGSQLQIEELEDDKLAEAHPHMAGVYHAIARDELSHADFFRREMEDHGYHLPEELEARWHKMLKKYGYAV